MTEIEPDSPAPALSAARTVLLAAAAVIAFQLAYTITACSFLIVVYLYCLFQLARAKTARLAFYSGLSVGLLAYAPQSVFFWNIFGPSALALWCLLAAWLGLFVVLARLCLNRFGKMPALLLVPFLWTGLEYFRSELYYLRFSWLNAGYVFSGNLQALPLKQLGVYGIGFVFMAIISLSTLLPQRRRITALATLFVTLGIITNLPPGNNSPSASSSRGIPVAGVQMEFPSEPQIITNLDRLIIKYPQAKLFLLSEYSVDGPVPDRIKAWCANNQRYLILGGKDPVSNSQFYDTVFVVGPDGKIIFRQAKCVPVQFFKDGLAAREQKLWDSPWGEIGICICYDLSYTRVTDQLIRLGAQAIIVPSMDAADWGRQQHELHARVARVRAAEYGVPVFRLASSGISQFVDSTGRELATAPTPGEEAMLSGSLELKVSGTLPFDRAIAPLSVGVTVVAAAWFAVVSLKQNIFRKSNPT